ncbi:MAG: hypothetical protein Q7T72_00235 [Bacteroidales bacterium]|nr:hypothetical protein [Bacteroidales bacterium]
MELDELKGVWAQYDKKLTENLRFNEELFIKMNLDKSKREMNGPYNYEIASVIVMGIFLIFILSFTFQYGHEIKYLISGLITSFTLICLLVFAMLKVKNLSNFDYYNSPVIKLQKSLLKFRQIYLKFKKYELYIFPVLAIAAIPILVKGMANIDILSNPEIYIIAVIGALVLGIPKAMWIYKHWYEKKIKNTSDFLAELNRFEKEEE